MATKEFIIKYKYPLIGGGIFTITSIILGTVYYRYRKSSVMLESNDIGNLLKNLLDPVERVTGKRDSDTLGTPKNSIPDYAGAIEQTRYSSEAERIGNNFPGGCDSTVTIKGEPYNIPSYEKRFFRAKPPRLMNRQGCRSRESYLAVMSQFEVNKNPRYTPSAGNTWCITFAVDVLRAMDIDIPEYYYIDGKIQYMSATHFAYWLKTSDATKLGFRRCSSEQEANRMALQGFPTIAIWGDPRFPNGDSTGHIAVVRPPENDNVNSEPRIMQAGAKNVLDINVYAIFTGEKKRDIAYYYHP